MTAIQFDRRLVLGGLLASTALGGCTTMGGGNPASAADAPADSASARARALYDRLFQAFLRANPESATSLGLDTGENADLRGKLGSSAAADRFGFVGSLAQAAPEMTAVAAMAASDGNWTHDDDTYLQVVQWFAERSAEIMRTPYGGSDGYPIPYTLTQLTGSYQSVPDFLDNSHSIANAHDAETYLARMAAFATNIDDEVARSRAESGMGVVPPVFVLTKALSQTRDLRAQRGTSAGMAANLARKTAERGIAGDWGTRAAALVDGPIAAALDRQIALLTDLQRRADDHAGVSTLPGGDAFYATCLRYHTSTRLTPQEAHARGLEEVADYESRLDPLLRAQGLSQGSVGARLIALGDRPDQLWPNTDEGRADLLAFANQRNDAIRPMMDRLFRNPPTTPLEIRRVPPAIEVGAPRGYAQRGSLDGSRPGAFYINLRDTRMWPRFAIPTLVYHEGIPGHVFQGTVLLASGNTPLLHRTLGIAAYGEGWGLYAEQLADELGIYDNEPLGRIGYLQAALYRAVRVVVDTGMHAMGWSKARALAYMIETSGLAPGAAENEIDRYIVWPGQATSYKLGHSEIVRARAAAQATMGNRFDIKGFHDIVLRSGSQPLELLRTNIDRWSRA